MQSNRKEAPTRRPNAARRPNAHVISSTTHGLIRWVQDLRQREAREQRAQFIVEGQRLVHIALESPFPPEMLLYSYPLESGSFVSHLIGQARRKSIKCQPVTPQVLAAVALHEDPQGVLAVVPSPVQKLAASRPPSPHNPNFEVWLGVESIQKPGNLGTILRTVEAVGAAGVVALENNVDFLDTAVVRASMGGLFGPTLLRATWAELLDWKQNQGVAWYATSPAATQSFETVRYQKPCVIWLGDERKGLTDRILKACDEYVRIPMVGRADSLNVSVSAGLLLYETLRQSAQSGMEQSAAHEHLEPVVAEPLM